MVSIEPRAQLLIYTSGLQMVVPLAPNGQQKVPEISKSFWI